MNKIILVLSFFLLTVTGFSQTGASYKFGDVGSWWIPKARIFGNSTVLTDSTNYVTLNKGLYIFDSLKVGKWMYVGVNGEGGIYLDTANSGQIYYSGNTLTINNVKSNGGFEFQNLGSNSGFNFMLGEQNSQFTIGKYRGGTGVPDIVTYDTANGLTIGEGDIQLSGGTQQIKIPSEDSVFTDYDANDNVTCNRQSGRITTKALTTSALGDYNLTLTNSLITANSIIICMPTTGSLTTGIALVRAAVAGSGSATIVIYNADASDPFNGTVGFSFVIFNN